MPGKHLKSWLSDALAEIVYPDGATTLTKKKDNFKAVVRLGHIVHDLNEIFTPGFLGMAPEDRLLKHSSDRVLLCSDRGNVLLIQYV